MKTKPNLQAGSTMDRAVSSPESGRSRRWRTVIPVLAVLLAVFVGLTGCYDREDGSCCGVDTRPPSAPRGFYSVTGDEEVVLHWLANPENDLSCYRIYRSTESRGYFPLMATVGAGATSYADLRVMNGATYYYAIAAVDDSGNESDLSEESVQDTPRPEGHGLRLSNAQLDPNESAYDFSAYRSLDFHDLEADIYFWETEEDGAWIVATERSQDAYTDVQDAGFVSLEGVDFAPTEGWSPAGEVPLVVGHSYVVWTADNHFAAFRVIELSPERVVLDWAYQVDRGNRELAYNPSGPRIHAAGGGLRVHQFGVKGR